MRGSSQADTAADDRLAKESAELLKDVLGTDADGGAAGDYKTTVDLDPFMQVLDSY
jgi:hypothetical protein